MPICRRQRINPRALTGASLPSRTTAASRRFQSSSVFCQVTRDSDFAKLRRSLRRVLPRMAFASFFVIFLGIGRDNEDGYTRPCAR